MKILLCSVLFHPSIGGIETVSAILAEQFQHLGHRVTVVTHTASDEPEVQTFAVVRRPSAGQLLRLVHEADVVLHNNISLRLAWPLLLLRRPWVVAHHTWIPRQGLSGRLKRWVLRFASSISVSSAIATDLPVPSVIVPNPYRDSLFRRIDGVARTKHLVFLGRLVSDKGMSVLLDALHVLRGRGLELSATLVGQGPEEAPLRAQACRLGLEGQIEFAGSHTGEALVTLLHRHHALVVPSVWEEPFGVVVLEAMACGCVPVVARSGGLPDAAGPGAHLFAKGDSMALADTLAALFASGAAIPQERPAALDHLARHQPERIAAAYLEVLSHVSRNSSAPFPA